VNGYLYVLYVDFNGDTVLARYTRSDPSTAQILFVAPQPKDNVPNHHGGTLLFGRDGFLYASIGDGGAYVRITNRAQELTHLLGKLLRLDVDHRTPYSIPGDNPLVNVAGARGEIWSYGLRNPWRFSFDRLSGDVLIGDVGQDSWEEVDINTLAETRGANYGWPLLEANHCLPAPAPCPAPAGLTTPKLEYPHTLGCSIAGGYRYRGSRWPGLYGVYLYGDYCSGRIWGATESATGSWSASELLHIDSFIVSFGEDDDGELYLVDRKGTIFAIAGTLPARRRAAL
jgi:glucose/arabinose dehydrogenase